ncbi:hypothetical protein J6590_084364 [Homalodisca vitripennis]|nr:hypothetical protein J6590_084364 [Homalodisca vitripennis]
MAFLQRRKVRGEWGAVTAHINRIEMSDRCIYLESVTSLMRGIPSPTGCDCRRAALRPSSSKMRRLRFRACYPSS